MPGKIKVKILAARNLPIMDRSAETTDAFCEVKLGTTTYKTDVYRKSLNPQWNSEWYRFEMDDAELQDEPLQIRVMDHDTYSANDAIGKLYLDLNPLLHLQCMYPTAKTIDASAPPVIPSMPSGSVLSGWFPVYDTMHGIRGEVHVTVKVELFSDFNKFRESSCGVQFFCSSGIPHGHNALAIHGFVEELIKTSDPEYQWIEKIRTPRVTNEARQTTFFKLSGEVHRKIGLKVIDMGGNAVIGYIQSFDLEGESGIVARGIGTVVTLVKIPEPISTIRDTLNEDKDGLFPLPSINIITDGSTIKGSPYTPLKKHRNSRKLYSRFPRKTNSFFSNTRIKLGKRHLQSSHDHRSTKKDHLSKSTESLDSKDDSSSVGSFQFDLQTMKSQRLMSAISSSTSSLSKKFTSLKHRRSPDRKKLKDRDTISFLITSIAKDPVFNFGHVYDSIEEESVKNLSVDLSKMSSRSSDVSASEIGSLSDSSSILTVGSQSIDYDMSDMVDTESLNLRAEEAKSSLRNASIESDLRQIENAKSEMISSSEIKESQQDIYLPGSVSKTSFSNVSFESDPHQSKNLKSEVVSSSPSDIKESEQNLCLCNSESQSKLKDVSHESELRKSERPKSEITSTSEMTKSQPNVCLQDKVSSSTPRTDSNESDLLQSEKVKFEIISNSEVQQNTPLSSSNVYVIPSKNNSLESDLINSHFSYLHTISKDDSSLKTQICLAVREPENSFEELPDNAGDIRSDDSKFKFLNEVEKSEIKTVNLNEQHQGLTTNESDTTCKSQISPSLNERPVDFSDRKSTKPDKTRSSQRDKLDSKHKRFSADVSGNETYDAIRKCKTVNELSHFSGNEKSSRKFSNPGPIKIRSYSRLEMEESFNFQDAPGMSIIQYHSNTLPSTKHQELPSKRKENLSNFQASLGALQRSIRQSRRSDTPPLSEMELFEMPPAAKKSFNKETIYSSQSGIHHLMVTSPSIDSNPEEELSYVPLTDSHSTLNDNVFKSMPDLSKKKVKSKAASISYKHFIDQTSSNYKNDFSAKSSEPAAGKVANENDCPISEISSNVSLQSVSSASAFEGKSSLSSDYQCEKQNSGILPEPSIYASSNLVDQSNSRSELYESAEFDPEISLATQAEEMFQVDPEVSAANEASQRMISKSSVDSYLNQVDSTAQLSISNVLKDQAAVELKDRATVELKDRTAVELKDRATVEIRDQSTVELKDQATVETPKVNFRIKVLSTGLKVLNSRQNQMMGSEVASNASPHQMNLNNSSKVQDKWQLIKANLIRSNLFTSTQSERNLDRTLSLIDELNVLPSQSSANTSTFPLYSSNLWGRKNLIHDLSPSYFFRNNIPSTVSHSVSDLRDSAVMTCVPRSVARKSESVDTYVSSSLNNVSSRVGFKSNHCTVTHPQSNLLRNYSSTPLFSDNYSSNVKLTRNNFDFNALTLNNSHLTLDLAKNLLNSIVDKQIDERSVVESTNNSLESSKIPVEPSFCDEISITNNQLNFCSGSLKLEITSNTANNFYESNFNNQSSAIENASLYSVKSNMLENISKPCLVPAVKGSNNSDDSSIVIAKFNSQGINSEEDVKTESLTEYENNFCNSVEKTLGKSDFLPTILIEEALKTPVKNTTETPKNLLSPFGEFDASQLITNCTLPPQNPLSNSTQSQGTGTRPHDGDGDISCSLTIPQSLTPSASKLLSQSPARVLNTHRRSSDSELSVTPKGNSLTGSGGTGMNRTFLPNILLQPITDKKMFELHDYPFLTMTRYPPGFIKRLGGTVSARSVKLLERSTIDEEPETRDTWWNELRLEVRSHARALACNVILGYSENTAFNLGNAEKKLSWHQLNCMISFGVVGGQSTVKSDTFRARSPTSVEKSTPKSDDVCILSAIGTAATIYFHSNESHHTENAIIGKKKVEPKSQNIAMTTENRRAGGDANSKRRLISENGDASDDWPCSMCHVPFKKSSMPFRVSLSKCLLCKRSFVPEILMTTIEPPEGIPILGEGCFLQAFIKRSKRDNRGELNAKEISDSAPFLEYELHRQLLNKLRVKGMNSIFSLKITISVGDRMITGHAAGTAVYLAALPILSLPTVTFGSNDHDVAKLEKIQKDLSDCVKKNRERFLLRPPSVSGPDAGGSVTSDSEDSDIDLPEADFAVGNMDPCVLEVDDNEDVDLIPQLIESPPPRNLIVTAAEVLPGVDDLEAVRNIQMFTQVWRGRIPATAPLSLFSRQFRTMLHKVYFKVRDMVPCALSGIRFLVDIPEPEEMQIIVFGMILGLAPCEKPTNKFSKRRLFMKTSNSGDSVKKPDENDLIFNLEEETDDNKKSSGVSSQAAPPAGAAPVVTKFSGGTPAVHFRPKERYGIDITPLSFVPGAKIERYLGNMNLFFIREGTSIRENGGIGVFIHSFVTDVLAIMRAHVAALGGNAVVAYFMNQCILQNNPNKNQAQCLINVGGDAVLVNYRVDD